MRKAALLVNNEYDQVERPVRKSRGKAVNDVNAKPDSPYNKQKAANSSKLHMSLKDIKPLNEAQRQMMSAFDSGVTVTVGVGSAGTGKTIIACYLALRELLAGNIETIKIIRSAVPTRSQGFLPGSLEEKSAIYELPYIDAFNDLLQCGTAYEQMTKKGLISFCTSSYLRGLTFKDCVIVVDEIQNMDRGEVLTILSRSGINCKMICCGDTKQKDLKDSQSSYEYFMKLMKLLPKDVDVTTFLTSDIVRSSFVKRLLIAEENME